MQGVGIDDHGLVEVGEQRAHERQARRRTTQAIAHEHRIGMFRQGEHARYLPGRERRAAQLVRDDGRVQRVDRPGHLRRSRYLDPIHARTKAALAAKATAAPTTLLTADDQESAGITLMRGWLSLGEQAVLCGDDTLHERSCRTDR